MAILAAETGDLVASSGLLSAVTKATKVVGKGGLAGGPVGAGVTFGAVAAAAGAITAKAWSDSSDSAHALRLAEVRRNGRLVAASGVALGSAMRQLLTSFNWCLSVEEKRRGGLAGTSELLNFEPIFGTAEEDSEDGDVKVSASQHDIDKEIRRQIRRIWRLCDQPPPRAPPRGKTRDGMGRKVLAHLSSNGKRRRKGEDETGDQNIEVADKLFNPQFNSGDRGLCAALCYLLSSFILHRKKGLGLFSDGSRASLRLAVAALARHPAFDEEPPAKENKKVSADTIEFRRGALALLPLLDAALAWRPVDPCGWYGTSEDDTLLLVAHVKGVSTFQSVATRLKKCLNKAANGEASIWRRLSMHLDSVRLRELPHPWPSVWVLARDASMLLQNHTKVALRVELHRPASGKASPWADLPLLSSIRSFMFGEADDRPLIVAEVGPGIEWAMRPKSREGRNFELKLITTHGVEVCSKRLRRGQTFAFTVNVPQPPHRCPLPALDQYTYNCSPVDRASSSSSFQGNKGDNDGDDTSVCSTAAPPSHAPRVSVASSSASSSLQPAPYTLSSPAPMGGITETEVAKIPCMPAMSAPGPLETAICPQCLQQIRARYRRPTAETYAEGIQCDKCGDRILEPEDEDEGPTDSKVAFFHCRRCWHDLCYSCALRDMQDVWWGED